MKEDCIYIINPAYFLRNDVRRAIIGSYDSPNISKDLYEQNSLSIIHPFHAQMLSFFNGTRTLKECIMDIANYFELEQDDVASFIRKYIENPLGTSIIHNSHCYYLPKNVLIEKSHFEHKETYKIEDFNIDDELDVRSVRLYKPIKLIIETNLNCYTDCEYCYADRHNILSNKLVPIKRLLDLITEAKELNIPSIEVNGGEVLLHPQVDEILRHLDKNGYHPFISTKIPLSRERLLSLKAMNFSRIQISIDTLDEQELCRRLKVKSGYKSQLVQTMHNLDDLEFNWQVNVVLTKNNVDLDKHIKPLLTELVGFNNIQSIKITPVGFPIYKDKTLFSKIRPTLEELNNIKFFLSEFQHHNKANIIYDLPTCTNHYRLLSMSSFEERNRCVANQSGLVILPNGDVTICEELYWNKNFIIGNILQSSIKKIWDSPKALSLFYIGQNNVNTESNCARCNIFDKCRHNKGVCWKMVTMAYGQDNWDFPDPSCPNSNNYMREFSY